MTARNLRIPMAVAAGLALGLTVAPVRADLQLCNKTSYILDLALGVADKGATATRGWFRVDPGQCRTVAQGTLQADQLYLHARALDLYGPPPLPQSGHIDLCVAEHNFVLAGATACAVKSGRMVRFAAVKPSALDQDVAAYVGEAADYELDQARLAGIQRLLAMAGYDANPIDGIEGKKTEAAMALFLKAANLTAEAAKGADFFDTLVAAAKSTADGIGFSWCNDTEHTVMAALGVDDKGTVVTRGWYKLEPRSCLKPDLGGQPSRVYSFAEAVDGDGQVLRRADQLIVWGGTTPLCTRNVRFEISDHSDCLGRGLNATGFSPVDLAGKPGATVHLRE